MAIQELAEGIWEVAGEVKLGPGLYFPCRMVVVRLESGKLWLHSPVRLDDETAAQIDALGEVETLVAPNAFHHLFMAGAQERWSKAQVWAPKALFAKRPDLRFDCDLAQSAEEASWSSELEPLAIDGAPKLSEWVFWHERTKTMIVTDLLFNVHQARGVMTKLVLSGVGAWGRPSQSRLMGSLIKDKAAANASAKRLLSKPIERVVMAHGEPILADGRAVLKAALTRMGEL
jgi:hypothetical protein